MWKPQEEYNQPVEVLHQGHQAAWRTRRKRQAALFHHCFGLLWRGLKPRQAMRWPDTQRRWPNNRHQPPTDDEATQITVVGG